MIVICVHALVHPGIAPFVAAECGIEPVVAYFMFYEQVEVFGCMWCGDGGDGRVFHSAQGAGGGFGDADGIEGIFSYKGGAEADGVLDVVDAVLPDGGRSGGIIGVDFDDPARG